MNKKLLTLAVGAALAASSSIASADMGWYGKAIMVLTDDDTTGSKVALADGGGSKVGFKASAETDNGMTGFVTMEQWLNITGASGGGDANNLFGNARSAYVGLKGDFGSVAGGNQVSAYKGATAPFDLFGDTVGDANGGGNARTGLLQPHHAGNAGLSYSNSFDGVSFAVSHQLETSTGAYTYTTGNVKFGFDALKVTVAALTGSNSTSYANAESAAFLGVKWSMDNIGLQFQYQNASDFAGTSALDESTYSLGGTVGVGNGVIKARYSDTDSDTNARDRSNISVGYEQSLGGGVMGVVHYNSLDSETDANDVNSWDAGIVVSF